MTLDLVAKGYAFGTHRQVPPEATLERVTPWLGAMGITRLADVTGLDCLGIPTFCALRPAARIVQVSNGKGLRAVDAQVSALMEAIELYHAEEPRLPVVRASFAELHSAPRPVVHPRELPAFQGTNYYDDRLVIDWVEAEELHSGTRWLVPASAAYPASPSLYAWWTNGLASGNHLVEATLHALYEAIERHSMAETLLPDPDPLAIFRPRVKCLRLATIKSPPVLALCECVARADAKLVLASVRSPAQVHTFWALLLDKRPGATTTKITTGYGTHASPTVAAIRAITEAAQSRLSIIQGSREDLAGKMAYKGTARLAEAFEFYDQVTTGGDWRALDDHSQPRLSDDYTSLLRQLAAAGVSRVFRIDLTRQPFGIPVVKVLVPGLLFDERWM